MVASETTSSKACKLYQVSSIYNEEARTRTMKKKIKNPRFEFTFEDGKISPCLSRKAISSKFVLASDKSTQKYTLWHECSLVNMLDIFRTPFLKIIFE